MSKNTSIVTFRMTLTLEQTAVEIRLFSSACYRSNFSCLEMLDGDLRINLSFIPLTLLDWGSQTQGELGGFGCLLEYHSFRCAYRTVTNVCV